ncbi:HopJ type III effector protein [Flavivirga spongiicola]|uniref:HopJ type III effector protein n=1 Tax=Flavivirga spongiicola TaxID=421621 RepID=A0ABU7XTE2_9FLAO|nr:HopJ type III effector protein [Flavivirga sp. MEBiC05379]MDO5979056.1 HopJ type III effector protein [Flavivirga sp. MEBiC05379]
MTIELFKNKLKSAPRTIEFSETMDIIESNYNFFPVAFTNGPLKNKSGENLGSCKLFAFAKVQDLTKEETLACFGKFYFDEVLNDPNGSGHQNIRNFIKTGFDGLSFNGEPLSKK